LYISDTKLLRVPLTEPLSPSSDFETLGKDSATPHGSVELPKQHLELVSHAISSQILGLSPGSQNFVVIRRPLGEARANLQTIRGVVNP